MHVNTSISKTKKGRRVCENERTNESTWRRWRCAHRTSACYGAATGRVLSILSALRKFSSLGLTTSEKNNSRCEFVIGPTFIFSCISHIRVPLLLPPSPSLLSLVSTIVLVFLPFLCCACARPIFFHSPSFHTHSFHYAPAVFRHASSAMAAHHVSSNSTLLRLITRSH